MSLVPVFDDVPCSSPVFCIIGLVVCSLALFLEPAFSLFLIVFFVYSLLFVLCPWSCRGGFLLPHAGHHARLPPRFPSIIQPLMFLFIVFVPCSCSCSLLLMLFVVLVLVFSCLCCVLKLWFGDVWYCSLFWLLGRCPLFVLVVSIVVFGLLVFIVSDLVFVLKKIKWKQRARIWNKEQEQ